jgi:hypothetical protein
MAYCTLQTADFLHNIHVTVVFIIRIGGIFVSGDLFGYHLALYMVQDESFCIAFWFCFISHAHCCLSTFTSYLRDKSVLS